MQQAFDQAKNLLDQSHNILLTMHERMDGDDGGALLAIAKQLTKQGKKVTCSIKKGVPPSLTFLPGSRLIVDDIDNENFDLLIVFGCSTLDRTGSTTILNLKSKILNIDHHHDNQKFGDLNIVDSEKSSVAELIYDFFLYNDWTIDKDIATCLLTGIITDTGSFMHSNTKDSTLKAAAYLMRRGAVAEKIIRHTYKNKDSKTLKAWGKALTNLQYDARRKIIYSVLTEKDLEDFGELPHSAFEGLAETLNSYPEAKFAMFLRQDGRTIKGSLRTDPFKKTDVSEIARIFGGGGHKMAAGFSVAGKLVKDETGKWRVT
jgi:bifunctional oligoribonuclease and PAP phosphatase NrnA